MTKKLNSKRRKKMRRKIKRSDIGWEKVLTELTIYEMGMAGKERNEIQTDTKHHV